MTLENRSARRLLVFDSWTKGSIHIVRLLDSLRARNIDTVFVHLGSWGDDPGRPHREELNGLEVRDIAGYRNIRSVLDAEKPDAVLFLSLDPLLHRAFNRYCRQVDLPTVNLYPGLWSAQAYDELGTNRKDLRSYWRWVASRLRRFGRYVFPVYIAALIRTRATLDEWRAFVAEVYNKLAGNPTLRAPEDAATHYICVYNAYDADHARTKYEAPSDRIAMVGIPDLIKFQGLEKLISRYTDEASEQNELIVYIGTGVNGTRMKIPDNRDYLQHLRETSDTLRALGKKLVCKLHYSRARAIQELSTADEAGIAFCDDDQFVDVLASSCGAIVEPSTAALVPIVMGKPLFLARYGRLAGLQFGPILTAYPKSTPIESLAGLSSVREASPREAVARTDAWIGEVAGPLPASGMPERVANVISTAMNARAGRFSRTNDGQRLNP